MKKYGISMKFYMSSAICSAQIYVINVYDMISGRYSDIGRGNKSIIFQELMVKKVSHYYIG